MRPRRVRGPGSGHDFDAFVEARIRLFHGDTEPGEFAVPVPFADTEIDPPARQQVEGGDLLGQQHRIVPGQHQHRSAERNVVVRAPIQVNKFKLADTWPKPVKWCSTRNVLT